MLTFIPALMLFPQNFCLGMSAVWVLILASFSFKPFGVLNFNVQIYWNSRRRRMEVAVDLGNLSNNRKPQLLCLQGE